MSGPLKGLRVVEMAGIGPGPFCVMVLADLGAEVVRAARPGATSDPNDVLARSRTVLPLDLRDPASVQQVLDLVAHADA
ncbi:MAG: CoA transferase, partial [Hydrogenophaga sp.]|nr:CoA transferase [Hydrogenophaga sp.]